MTEIRFYKLSKEKPIGGIILTFITGLFASFILGILYALLITSISYNYFHFILAVTLGVTLGRLIARSAKLGHVRDENLIQLFGCLLGIAGVYFSWVFWEFFLDSNLIWNPIDIFFVAQKHNVKIDNYVLSQNLTYGMWIVEAVIIFVSSYLSVVISYSNSVYCEHCESWIDSDEEKQFYLEEMNTHNEEKKIEKLDFESLKRLKKYVTPIDEFVVKSTVIPPTLSLLVLKKCKTCSSLCLLDLSEVSFSLKKIHKVGTKIVPKHKSIITNAVISHSQYSDLIESMRNV